MSSSSDLPTPIDGVVAPAIGDREHARTPTNMTLSDIFFKAFEIYRDNPIIILPSLIPIAMLILGFAALFAGFVGLAAVFGTGGFLALSTVGGLVCFIIILLILFIVAEGVTIEMVKEAVAGNRIDLNSAMEASKEMVPLILSSALAGIIIGLGYMLLIIPGIILSIILYFVAQAVMIEGKLGLEALKTSYNFVKVNLSDSMLIIVASLAISIFLPMIPMIGFLLSLISLPYIYALATLLY